MPPAKKRGRPRKTPAAIAYESDDEMDVDEAPSRTSLFKDVARFATTHPYATSALGAGAGLVLLSKLNQAGILTADNVFNGIEAINPTLGQATRGLAANAQGWIIAPALADSADVRQRAAENFQLVGEQMTANQMSNDQALDFFRKLAVAQHGPENIAQWWQEHVTGADQVPMAEEPAMMNADEYMDFDADL